MKVKILIFPLALVIVIWLAVWQISPQFQAMQANNKALDAAKAKLDAAQKKNADANNLMNSFNSMAEDRKVIFKYIPDKRNEEEFMNSISSIAGVEGVAFSGMKLQGTDKKNKPSAVPEGMPPTSYLPPSPAAGGPGEKSELMMPVSPSSYLITNDLGLSMGVVGSYEKIKSFLAKVANFKRFNTLNSLDIGRADSADNKNPSMLQASLSLTFNYFDRNMSASAINEATFSGQPFDLNIIENIKNKLSTDIVPVTVGQTGKTNPFLP